MSSFLKPCLYEERLSCKRWSPSQPSQLYELLYEKKVDPFARPPTLGHASLKQLLRKLWLSIASVDRVDPAGRVKVLLIMEESWPV